MASLRKRMLRAPRHQRFPSIGRAAQQTLKAVLVCAFAMTAAVCFSGAPSCQTCGFARSLAPARHPSALVHSSGLATGHAATLFAWALAGCALTVRGWTCLQATDRDFEMEQVKLRMDQVLCEKQGLEEEKQKALDSVKPLEKSIKDLQLELQASTKQASDIMQTSLQESARLKEALEQCRLLEREKEQALLQTKALDRNVTDLKKDLQEYQQRSANHAIGKEQESLRLQAAVETARRFEQEKDAALARVRALEKALQDTKSDVAASQQNLQSKRQDELQASAASADLAAERDALTLQVQGLKDTMSNIMELATGKLTDPENDPFVRLREAKEAVAASELRAEALEKENTAALAKRDEALAETELRSKALESLELRSKSLEELEERAQRLSKLLQSVADVAGASPGILGLFQSKKSDEEIAEDIKAKIKELLQRL